MRIQAPYEELTIEIEALDKDACIRELHAVPHLKLDFTDEFLQAMTLDRVRHVLMAAVLQARKHEPSKS